MEATFDENTPAFLQVPGRVFGIPPPNGDVNKGSLLLPLTAFIVPDPVQGETKLGDGCAVFCFSELGIASQIAYQGNTIITAHENS